MIRKSLGLLAGMLVTVAVYAAGAQLRTDHPDNYVVRRGDTLWDISARFLSKPWLWPEIWQANPQIQNPHLIYPGDVLNLSFINGPHLKLEPSIHREGEAITAIPLSQLKPFLLDTRVVDSSELKSTPYVMGFEEAQIAGTPGQNIYVRGLQAVPGQRWAIVRPTHIFRGFKAGSADSDHNDLIAQDLDSDVSLSNTPWWEDDRPGKQWWDSRDERHFTRGKDLGVEVIVLGTAEVLRSGDPSTLLLLNSTAEVRAGDRLLPVDENPYDPYFYPHPPKSLPADGRVIALDPNTMDVTGPRSVVALSVGAKDGVDNGTTFAIWAPGEAVSDDVAHSAWHRDTGKSITLPDEYVGHVMVFRTFDRVSYGLIMDGLKPTKLGYKLKLPE
jgi:hypothetical protein